MKSLLNGENENYYYFAGKNTPMEIILKYQQRGFDFKLPVGAQNLLNQYTEQTPKWNLDLKAPSYILNKPYPEKLRNNFNRTNYCLANAVYGYGNFNVELLYLQRASLDYISNTIHQEQLSLLKQVLTDKAYSRLLEKIIT